MCMCWYVYRLGYVLLCLYITVGQYGIERPNDIISAFKGKDARITKY